MAKTINTANSYVNASQTYKVDRILPQRNAATGWSMAKNVTGDYATPNIPVVDWAGGATDNAVINLSVKSEKPGEKQYVSTAGEGLSPALALKVGYKAGKNIYGFSTLSPEKMANTPDWVQVVISTEELFRASRITKVVPVEGSSVPTYECYGETGHLPLMAWTCIRVPKHVAFNEALLEAFIADHIGCLTTNKTNDSAGWTKNFMDLVRGDVTLS